MTEGCSRVERKTKLMIEEARVAVSFGQFELLRVRWIEVSTIIKPRTVTSSILSSCAYDPRMNWTDHILTLVLRTAAAFL